ncbi:hypothetical protein DFH09DRAFT_1149743, partial [Mycena vulgaris]
LQSTISRIGSLRGEQHQLHDMLERTGKLVAENTRAMEAMKRENAESMLKVDKKLQFLFENEDRLIAGAQSALDKQEMVEIHEALSMCLQGYNDIIFNINRPPRRAGELVLTWGMKQELKADGFHYITQLFCPPRNLLPLSPEADSRRRQALRILTPQEESLCADMVGRLLGGREERNTEQHPKPDRETTLHRLRDLGEAHHGLLRYYLASNPQRIPGRKEPLGVDLSIFPSDGTYVSAAQGRIELERMKAKRAELEMTL